VTDFTKNAPLARMYCSGAAIEKYRRALPAKILRRKLKDIVKTAEEKK
jgi:hypothetical protein